MDIWKKNRSLDLKWSYNVLNIFLYLKQSDTVRILFTNTFDVIYGANVIVNKCKFCLLTKNCNVTNVENLFLCILRISKVQIDIVITPLLFTENKKFLLHSVRKTRRVEKKPEYIKQRKKSIRLTWSSTYKFLLSTLPVLLLFPSFTRDNALANKFKRNKKS